MFVPLYFRATAQSVITWGRETTAPEGVLLATKKEEMITAGAQLSNAEKVDGVTTVYWATLAQAQEWVAYCNTFTPAPQAAAASSIS